VSQRERERESECVCVADPQALSLLCLLVPLALTHAFM